MFPSMMVVVLGSSLGLPPPAARTDAHGDPMPRGALMRLGTARLGHFQPITWVGFTHDSKCVITASNDGRIRWWNAVTGLQSAQYRGGNTPRDYFALSGDGRKMILPDLNDYSGLALVEAVSRKEDRRITHDELLGPQDQRVGGERFILSPDGRFLAIWDRSYIYGEENRKKKRSFTLLRVWDMRSGSPIREWKTGDLFEVEFSPDGRTLLAQERARKSENASLRSWDVGTGKELKRVALPRLLSRFFLLPDGMSMVGLSNNRESLAIFETKSGKEIRILADMGGPIDSFALSRDGKQLAVAQGGKATVRNMDDGKTVLAVAANEMRSEPGSLEYNHIIDLLAFSPDGKVLAVGNGRRLDLWDLASGLPVHRFADAMRGPLDAIHVHGDHLLARDSDAALSLWDLRNGKFLRRFVKEPSPDKDEEAAIDRVQKYYYGGRYQAISPDGRRLAALWPGGLVHLFDLANGKRLQLLAGSASATCLAFSPDGKLLAAPAPDGRISLWNITTGKPVQHLSSDFEPAQFLSLCFSPDGRTLSASALSESSVQDNPGKCAVSCWELASGSMRYRPTMSQSDRKSPNYGTEQVDIAEDITIAFVFAPDGKHIAAAGPRHIRLWDAHTGKEVRRFGGAAITGPSAAISPDGKLLVAGRDDGGIRFWDIATGTVLRDVPAHDKVVTALAFAKEGKTLVSASLDSTAIVWDLAELLAPQPVIVKERLESLWDDMGSTDAEKALGAIAALTSRPSETIKLFEARLQPAASVDSARMRRWVNDLESEQFATRSQAARELERAGEQARPMLEKALTGTPTLELRRRVEMLLHKLAPPVTSAEQLRAIRAVEVLERIGTKEARRLLNRLADGARGPRLTEDARAALTRFGSKRESAK
jgi:WD40 repeat protein